MRGKQAEGVVSAASSAPAASDASSAAPKCILPPEALAPDAGEAALKRALETAGAEGGARETAGASAPRDSGRGGASVHRMTGPDKEAPAGWCTVCEQVKPPRAHHCMVTNRCVLRMDHFCPWTN